MAVAVELAVEGVQVVADGGVLLAAEVDIFHKDKVAVGVVADEVEVGGGFCILLFFPAFWLQPLASQLSP